MSSPGGNPAASWRERLAGSPEPERVGLVLELICAEVTAVTGQEASRPVHIESPWRLLGIYRERAADLRQRLSAGTGLRITATIFFDYPSPTALATYLCGELLGERAEVTAPAPEGNSPDDDPIAIVGMACRFPGDVRSPEDLWQLVAQGRDAISDFPQRHGWDVDVLYHPDVGRPGTTYARSGGFLHDVDLFDPGFFGIGPREAAALDPQQRLLLETSWESLEHAGIDPLSLRGSRAGVYVGIAYRDYGPRWHEPPPGYEGSLLTGGLISVASGRISYTLGLEGPAITVDTACSSSLVALHLAAQALRERECSLALAGGVTVMATPGVFLEFSRKRGLAPDGRCKSFSAGADGTGWGEGAGMLVLERLSDAHRSGHRVLALMRGSALNQDGASNGLTAPNGLSQQRVIRQALANAGLLPHEVDAVEGHGTGTTLGDPIEAQALIATYGQFRPDDRPLWLGSLKSNIGHSQAAAVVGGVIKMVLAIHHGVLPRTLHVTTPSAHVDWSAGAVSLLTREQPWPRTGRPRRAGVSAFGVSGTNGHLILEEASLAEDTTDVASTEVSPAGETFLPWVVSGKGAAALRAQADRLRAHVNAHFAQRLVDVGYSLATRTRFESRAVLVAADRDGFLRCLQALGNDDPAPGLVRGVVHTGGKVAVLFSGQGSQRPGMGRELYETFPGFARAWDSICACLDTHLDRPLQEVVWAPEGSPDAELLNRTAYTQPALFAFEVSLFRLVEEWGLAPDLLIGHSIGELAAAYVAGVFSLTDACALVAARGRLMQACRTGGVMVSIQASEEEVRAHLRGQEATVAVAAVNGPQSTVVSGDEDAVREVAAQWEVRGRKTTRLQVSHAFHSPHMDAVLDPFRRVADAVCFRPPALALVSNLTGRIATAEELCTPQYWVRQVRETVRFLDGMGSLAAEGVNAFLELGPDATLTALGSSCLTEHQREGAVLAAVSRTGRPASQSLVTALAMLHVQGVALDWAALFEGRGARRVELPTYAFQRQRYWLDPSRQVAGHEHPPPDTTGWRYRVAWNPVAGATVPLTGIWWVLAGASQADDDLASVLANAMTGAGAQVITSTYDHTELERGRLALRWETMRSERGTPDGIVSLLALGDTTTLNRFVTPPGLLRTIVLAQAWAETGVRAPLWCLTRGAVSVGDSDPLRNPDQAMVWGLGRCIGLEHPRRWGGLVDLPEVLDERALQRVCSALAGHAGADHAGEDQVAVRDSGVFVRRVVRAGPPGPTPRRWRPRGTVLITGGTGALGAHAGRWLARNGAERLVLVSRRGLAAPGAAELRAELTTTGVEVTVAACDVADRHSLARLLAALPADRPITAVVHAAGASGRLAALTEVSLAEFDDVVAAKVAGAIHLDTLLAEYTLDAFVLISSVAGVWGSGGQAAYAAGNAFLDALAHQRRARELRATSVAWGPWAEGGMAADPAVRTHLLQRGLTALRPPAATAALWESVAAGETAVTVADVQWQRFLPVFTAARSSRLFDELTEPGSAARQLGIDQALPHWSARLTGAFGTDRDRVLLELVRTSAAEILGHARPEDIADERPFFELGLDSVAAVELRNHLVSATGLTLSTTVVFDHPTVTTLAGHLGSELARKDADLPGTPGQAPLLTAHPVHPVRTGAEAATVRVLYRRACELDMFDTGIELVDATAKLRPVFRHASDFGAGLELIQLATGPATPALVCFPPFVAPCGPHNYARLAMNLHGLRSVYSLPHPGFGTGEPLPATTELIVAMHAEAVRRQLGDTPFAVAGYSSGGWFAHAVTAHLEKLGIFPTAVVLLDSLALRDDAGDYVRPPLKILALNDQAFALMTDDQLTATAAYFRLFENWKPTEITTPVLLARATECVPEWEGEPISEEYWRASWNLDHEILDLAGDHSSIMNENAASTASALHRWLSDQ